jgi:hypothetical protein
MKVQSHRLLVPGLALLAGVGACNIVSGKGDTPAPVSDPVYDGDDDDDGVDASSGTADASSADAAAGTPSATVHPMNYVEVGASPVPVTMTIGATTWTMPTATTDDEVVVVIPMLNVGSGLPATLSRNGQTLWKLEIVPEPAPVSAPGASVLAFLETLRTYQVADAGADAAPEAGADGGTSGRPDIDALEALVSQAASAPVVMGTIAGATATLDATSLATLDAALTALHEATVTLPAGSQARSLTGLLSGPLSAVSDATGFIMNAAQEVAGIPPAQIEAPDGWVGSMLAFVTEHTPNADGSPLGQVIVAIFGNAEARAIAQSLQSWSASHQASASEAEALTSVQDVTDLQMYAATAPESAGDLPSGSMSDGGSYPGCRQVYPSACGSSEFEFICDTPADPTTDNADYNCSACMDLGGDCMFCCEYVDP